MKTMLCRVVVMAVLISCLMLPRVGYGQQYMHMGTTRILNGVHLGKGEPPMETITNEMPPDGRLMYYYLAGNPTIVSVNGDTVVPYDPINYDEAARSKMSALRSWFAAQMESHVGKLSLKSDGCIHAHVCKCIIDRNGLIAYFEYRGTYFWEPDGLFRSHANVFSEALDQTFMQMMLPIPVGYQGRNVAVLLPDSFFDCEVCIEKGVATLFVPGEHAARHLHYTPAQLTD